MPTSPRQWQVMAIAGGVLAAALLVRVDAARRAAEARAREAEHSADAQLAFVEKTKASCLEELTTTHGRSRVQHDAAALLQTPGTRVIVLKAQGSGSPAGSVLFDGAGKRAIVITTAALPASGKTLQLWVVRGKTPPVPGGTLRAGMGGILMGEIDPRALAGAPPDAFAVSIEAAEGRLAPSNILFNGSTHGP